MLSCITGPSKDIVSLTDIAPEPVIWQDAKRDAVYCPSPILPKKKITPSFTYGCFCGKGYPDLQLPGNAYEKESKEEARVRLAALYFGVKPVDEIDAACQRHDICYILNGGAEFWCDATLNDELSSYQTDLDALISTFEINTPEWRCQILARDIDMAALSLFPSGSKQSLMGTSMQIVKIIGAPITALYLMTTVGAWDTYPKGHYCELQKLKNNEYASFYLDLTTN